MALLLSAAITFLLDRALCRVQTAEAGEAHVMYVPYYRGRDRVTRPARPVYALCTTTA